MKTLYDITGDIKDINTLLVQRLEYEAQSQDARRYQWLREQQWQDNKLGVVLRPKDNTVLGCFIPSKELLDGAIDRYMSGKNDAMQGGQQP